MEVEFSLFILVYHTYFYMILVGTLYLVAL